jgi:hypothetical protein
MGWEPGDGLSLGDVPEDDGGQPGEEGDSRARLLASFERGGAWEAAAPSGALARVLELAAGPDRLYDGAEAGALVGLVHQWAALESWASAGLMAAMRAMMREDSTGHPLLRRDLGLPDGWDDSLNYEVAEALAMGPVSATNLANLAWALGIRLPGIGQLLGDGVLTRPKAKLVVQIFGELDEDEAARAEALIVDELAGKTYLQVERLAWRAALAVAPDVAERRRSKAEKRARVVMFREESGTVALSGRDLPAADALTGHAKVLARAQVYAESGAFAGQALSVLESLAFTDLLAGISAADRIAFARTNGEQSPESGKPGPEPDKPDSSGNEGEAPGSGGTDQLGRGGPGQGGPDGDDPSNGPPVPPRAMPEVTVPLATLLRLASRAGENRLLGPLDPALARDLAAAAARSPHSQWEVIIVDDHGYAIGHGIAHPGRGRPQAQARGTPTPAGLNSLPARVNITITETFLRHLAGQPAVPRSGAPPDGWGFFPWEAGHGSWTLTLPGGRELTVRFDVVPTHDCDHRHATDAYQPSDKLRRLVQVRDRECTFPTCSRHARDCDFEHGVPYDQGGITDACNAGARSRRCHQVKQAPGWSVTQPKPGWHVWTTPTGRTYVQEPWRYIA